MTRALAAAAFLVACDSGQPAPDGGGSTCDGGCSVTIAEYCMTASCPTVDPALQPAVLCSYCGGHCVSAYTGQFDDAGNVLTCGYTLVFTTSSADAGQEQVWDTSGHLVAIFDLGVGVTCCASGPPGFEAPSLQGCTLIQPVCDAGPD